MICCKKTSEEIAQKNKESQYVDDEKKRDHIICSKIIDNIRDKDIDKELRLKMWDTCKNLLERATSSEQGDGLVADAVGGTSALNPRSNKLLDILVSMNRAVMENSNLRPYYKEMMSPLITNECAQTSNTEDLIAGKIDETNSEENGRK